MNNKICLVIEGAYPYVAGGVASWIHQIITKLNEFDFYLIVLLASEEDSKKVKYKLPENVKGIYHIFLQKKPEKPLFLPDKLIGADLFKKFIENATYANFVELIQFLNKAKNRRDISVAFFYAKESFELIEFLYKTLNTDVPFLNFYRAILSLTMNFSNILTANPEIGGVIHTISTGFAGLLASILKISNPKVKLLLTEHGIYTNERDIEISFGIWKPDKDSANYLPKAGLELLKELWRNTFLFLSETCYLTCDKIITLHEQNRQIEIDQGAPNEKIMIIRNGIDLEQYKFRHRKAVSNPPVVGFLGRIVKIKDIKTLIRAAKIVVQKMEYVKFKIAGPFDEDPDYFEECKSLVKILLLDNSIEFLGPVNAVEFLNEIDLLVLTSISEGQPLVIAEAASCGIPAIATDVGGCYEMLYGCDNDKLGQSGIIAEKGNAEDIAKGILTLIHNDSLYSKCSEVGRARVEKFYNEETLIESYRKIYSEALKN